MKIEFGTKALKFLLKLEKGNKERDWRFQGALQVNSRR